MAVSVKFFDTKCNNEQINGRLQGDRFILI